MEQDRKKPNLSPSSNEKEDSQEYEAPEITKHEALRDITAMPTPDYGVPGA